MAVACGDPYVRIYDRRKLSLGGPGSVFPLPLLVLAPPHLTIRPLARSHTTYVNFSNAGDKVELYLCAVTATQLKLELDYRKWITMNQWNSFGCDSLLHLSAPGLAVFHSNPFGL